jgi:hypothetical protein
LDPQPIVSVLQGMKFIIITRSSDKKRMYLLFFNGSSVTFVKIKI